MKTWIRRLFYAAIATFVSLGGCTRTCPVQYPAIQVVDANGNVTAEVIDNGVIVTPAK